MVVVADQVLVPVLGHKGRDDSHVLAPPSQEARPESVGAVRGDGVVTQGQQRQIEGGRQGRGSGDLGVQQ